MNSTTANAFTTAIDFRTLPACIPSLCIPRVYTNISEGRIRKIFNDLNLGVIERIDIVNKTTEKGERFNRVFIHMERWFQNGNASVARERLLNGKDIKVIYDDPWFWKVSAYRESNNNNNNNNNRSKATIQFDSSDEEKERRQPKDTDIKPLLEPRPRSYNNNNNARKVKREDIDTTYREDRRPPIREDRRPPIREDRRPPIREDIVPIIREERPPIREDIVPIIREERKPIVRDNTPKIEVPPPVQYDPAVIASTKKRVIIIKK